MPAKDIYHDTVRNALIKAGWTITHDPLRLVWGAKDMFIDLGAEQLLAAEKSGRKIAIQIIEQVLTEYASIPYAHGDIHTETVFDRSNDHYLLVNVGWQNGRRVHGSLVHVDIINDKIWIQRDGTEHGIANDLVEAGIPKDQIVLGFRAPEVRQYTEFAVE